MILTITTSIAALVIINFLLLKFSTNKVNKTVKTNKKPVVLTPRITIEQEPVRLAPTGS